MFGLPNGYISFSAFFYCLYMYSYVRAFYVNRKVLIIQSKDSLLRYVSFLLFVYLEGLNTS